MNTETFLSALDEAKIVSEIAEVEKKTSGEVRVFITHHRIADPFQAAAKHFVKLGMEKTRERNAVLLFFAPKSHKFAVIGDKGVHEKCGDQFWNNIALEMQPLLKKGQFTEAILLAVKQMGTVLRKHFPPRPDDRNELPNDVEKD